MELSGGTIRIGACAKGSGMIHPNMATMLAYITTDAKVDAAVVIEEKDLTGEKLVAEVKTLLDEDGKLARMGRNARTLSVDDSLDQITSRLRALVRTP